MADFATRMIAHYIKENDIPIGVISRSTDISINILYRFLIELGRPLRTSEFLAICDFFNKDLIDFKDISFQQVKKCELG
jgi:hypothetical protein